jgi:phosphate transport system substrate-binding protein
VDPVHEKILAIAADGDDFIYPTVETAASGEYPLSRDLYMYTAGEPTGAIAEYLSWILSPAGQKIVSSMGFVPVTQE